MTGADVARKFLDSIQEELPKRTLAKRLFELHPEYFQSIESARSAIRGITGANNNGERVTHPRPHGTQKDRPTLPPSASVRRDPYILDSGKWLILSDTHFPYHDNGAILAALEFATGCDGILLNGDQIDFHRISRFVSDAESVSTAEELRRFADFLDYLVDRFPDKKLIHKEGNHEERLSYMLAQANKDLLGIDKFKLPALLDYNERGIEWVGCKREILAGHLTIFHGHELDRGFIGPVNPAKGLWDRTHVSALAGHWHRTSEHAVRNARNEISICWSVGCLCDLSPLYAPFNKWNHGFGLLDLARDGTFRFENKRIINGQVF